MQSVTKNAIRRLVAHQQNGHGSVSTKPAFTVLFMCGLSAQVRKMDIKVRPARRADADAISRVVLAALRTSNARDYPVRVIERVQLSFSPSAIERLMQQRRMFVAVAGEVVVGTASLEGQVVRSVFVDPDWHRRGVGRLLMAKLERVALEIDIGLLIVPSSLTAQEFYKALGFRLVREHQEGEERTLIMERQLRT
ncbi:putative acetyltransferase [Pseudomonas amygdali pv. photiniae]|nr:putative acetyltransferase [Pseudomonas amygdali pv. myricae]KPX62823.1 putative acetyltransferase [Pseudomonas amygdali pv. photiniae]KPY45453.1 Acetyltransferase, GNAT family [Pseudomonas savastanoi pv. retacarpa]KPY51669.1 putative acetyltransferase [Pseudomonas syringae pv. rhaphiolepidis]KUG43239.1 putative acetyltransferase [Pseudomonas savastanoi pv. fraxini]RMU45569.1 putative acetyltransferase [Pseudomonas savastanoi pv. nerii]